MKEFTIRDIENLSGIKAHTWRIWEQRYGIGVAKRKDSNHRFYDNENLKQILRIAYLYNSGIKISKISLLDAEEIKKLALSELPRENGNEFYIKELLEAAIDLDEEKFDSTFSEALKRTGTEDAIIKIINVFQKKIGVLWLTDHVIPAQEHFTSNIIRQKLAIETNNLPFVKRSDKRTIALFTPEWEMHEIPLQFINYLLKKNRNKVIYFGCNVLLESIELYYEHRNFTHLMFHVVTNLTNKQPDEYLQDISQRFPEVKILMSGPGVRNVHQVPGNVRCLASMEEIMQFTKG